MSRFMPPFSRVFFALFAACCSFAFASSGVGDGKSVRISETVLGDENELPMRSLSEAAVSPDGFRLAYAAYDRQQRARCRFVLDGVASQTGFRAIVGIVFSPDSRRVAYIGLEDQSPRGTSADDNIAHVVVDGKTVAKYPKGVGVNGCLTFSPDSTRVLWAVARANGYVIVDGGKELTSFPVAFFEGPIGKPGEDSEFAVFAPDGKSLAYAQEQSGHVVWMVNGKTVAPPGRGIDRNMQLVFSGGSGRFAVAVVADDGSRFMVVDGKAGKAYAAVGRPVFSSDSKHVAFAAAIRDPQTGDFGGGAVVVLDGVESERWEKVDAYHFTADGSTLVYKAWRVVGKGRDAVATWYVVTGRSASAPYEEVRDLVLSPVGNHVAFVGQKGRGKEAIVFDGKETGEYANVAKNSLVFSPDGQRLAYSAVAKANYHADLYVDGKKETAKGKGTTPVFSPDGSSISLVPNVVFSPDGKHEVAYNFLNNTLELDGKTIATFDKMAWMPSPSAVLPRFIDARTFRVLAVKDKKVVRVEVIVPDP